MKRRYRRLSDEQIMRLRQLWMYGVKADAIAAEFGIGRDTVQHHTRDMKRRAPADKKIDDDTAFALKQLGYHDILIAKCFGVTDRAVRVALERVRSAA